MHSACDNDNRILSDRFSISTNSYVIERQPTYTSCHYFALIINAFCLIGNYDCIFLPTWGSPLGSLKLLLYCRVIINRFLCLIRGFRFSFCCLLYFFFFDLEICLFEQNFFCHLAQRIRNSIGKVYGIIRVIELNLELKSIEELWFLFLW